MYVFIINPIAGNGRAKHVFLRLTTSKLFQKLNSIHFFTEYQGHAEKIAYNVSTTNKSDITGIIVVGGDGTFHEVVNGVKDKSIPLSLIPSGSGNDFARGCSIEGKPIDILRKIINNEHETPYWLGEFTTDNLKQADKRNFANSIGFGFDAEIAETVNRSVYKKIFNSLRLGKISYIIALIQVLFRFKPMNIEVNINGKAITYTDCWMVSVTNHPFYGGGMKVVPFAKIQPVKFSVLIIKSISRLKILSLFLTVFTGDHIKFKEVEIVEATNIKITSSNNNGLIYQVDGESSTCRTCTIHKQINPIRINGSTNVNHVDQQVN